MPLLRLCALLAITATADAYEPREDEGNIGGPSSVYEDIRADRQRRIDQLESDLERLLRPYTEFKKRIYRDYGISYGLDYSALVQVADRSPGERIAASGAVRFFGVWEALNRGETNRGNLVFRVQHRHRLGTDIAPSQLGPEIGYAGLTATFFNDAGFLLTSLLWDQVLGEGRFAFQVGVIDATDYVHNYPLVGSLTGFNNFVFRRPTIPTPAQGVGFGARFYLLPEIYFNFGFSDSNADATDPRGTLNRFFEKHRPFAYAEFGWSKSKQAPFADNAHVVFWYDSPDEFSDAWGFALNWNRTIDERWIPFVRFGYSDQGATRWRLSITAGAGYQLEKDGTLMGLGLNWGRPNSAFFGADLDDQFTAEFFVRTSVTAGLTTTPHIQVLVNPALNPDEDVLIVVGLRVRIDF
ncbi:MAG: carbohydrate porin [Planctomycetota bacterium]